MTRENAKANLIALGVAEPTDEQISSYLNQFGTETSTLKTELANAKKDAQNVAELQKQLKDLQDSKLTDEEKATKEQQEREERIASLEAELKKTNLKSKLAEKGIIGDDADKLIDSINSGSFDVALLGEIISARETEAAKKKEEEIAKKSSNPGGGNEGGDDTKPDDVANAEKLKAYFGTQNNDADNKNYYVMN